MVYTEDSFLLNLIYNSKYPRSSALTHMPLHFEKKKKNDTHEILELGQ